MTSRSHKVVDRSGSGRIRSTQNPLIVVVALYLHADLPLVFR